MKKSITLFSLFLAFFIVDAQSSKDLMKRYNLAKDHYNAKQYPQAYLQFQELTTPSSQNAFVEYATFYTALCAYKQEKYLDAKFILKQLEEKYPSWEQKQEVYYLLADIYFRIKEDKQAITYLNLIQDAKLKTEAISMKEFYLRKEDVSTLKQLEQETKDKIAAKTLARKLDKKYNPVPDKMLLEYLIQDYHLDKKNYPYGTMNQNEQKKQYNVAVMLPFMLNESKAYRKYARFYELYEGIKLAVDTLSKQGIQVNLFVYDTQKDTNRVHQILKYREIQDMDLFIGPVYQQTSMVMKRFATAHKINYVNPLQDDGALIQNTKHVFLVKPSNEVKGMSFATYANASFPKKDVIVFYSDDEKDSVLAHSYIANLDQNTKRVVSLKKINNSNVSDIRKIIDNVDKTTLSHIFIANSENLAAATLMSALENNHITTPVIAPSQWLGIGVIEYEQFKRHNFYFDYDDYVNILDTTVQDFRTKFKKDMNLKPAVYAKNSDAYYGYMSMYFFGKMMQKHGNLFNEAIKKEPYHHGFTFMGINYQKTNANNIAPLYRFNEDYELQWVNFPR